MVSETDSAPEDTGATASKLNIPEYSVSEVSSALKRTVEREFGFVRVRGEVSGFRGAHASGHAYFSLKENDAKIEAVCFRNVFPKVRTKLSEGLEVIATGRISTYPGKSSYQIIVENIEPAGAGALMQLLEERRKKLAAEGLFNEERKKPIPYLPETIGVVTSPTGAVIRDILHRLSERFPRRVLVWPVSVQGEKSAAEVSAAIAGFNALKVGGSVPRPDVIIVARGGGSIEDLWPFNEEIVVRATAASDAQFEEGTRALLQHQNVPVAVRRGTFDRRVERDRERTGIALVLIGVVGDRHQHEQHQLLAVDEAHFRIEREARRGQRECRVGDERPEERWRLQPFAARDVRHQPGEHRDRQQDLRRGNRQLHGGDDAEEGVEPDPLKAIARRHAGYQWKGDHGRRCSSVCAAETTMVGEIPVRQRKSPGTQCR